MQTLVVFLVAEEGAGARALQKALASGHHVVGVMTTQSEGGPAALARRAGVPTVPATTPADELAELVRRQQVDLLLNVHSLRILPTELLEGPTIGCFNLHPGPLPRFAGLNAPSWAIFEGETTYGCSLHWMAAEVDAGPIAYAAEFAVDPDETGLSLGAKCTKHGVSLVEALLRDAGAGGRESVPAHGQDLARRRYLPPGPPGGGRVPWSQPAARVDAFVRACAYDPFPSPWGSPWTTVAGRNVEIRRLSRTGRPAAGVPGAVGESHVGAVEVAAADEWVLVEDVRVDGEPATPAAVLPRGARCEPDTPT